MNGKHQFSDIHQINPLSPHGMTVSEALNSRITCRAFKNTPIPEETVKAVLQGATRAPSGGNLQPWFVWALTGQELEQLKMEIAGKIANGQISDGNTEYNIYPPEMKEPYISRKQENGRAVYASINIPRDDEAARNKQIVKNFEFFGAPVGLFFAIDRSMQQGQWSDLGMYIMSVMLLAREHGLHSAALESWALWYKTTANFLNIPKELMLFCGMALGHMDLEHPINSVRVPRAPLREFATLRGF